MQVFDDGLKVNFVDENNVVLGYDMEHECCEHADWFIADKVTMKIVERGEDLPDLEGWVFDTCWFGEVTYNDLDDGGMVIFRITKDDAERFIHLYNCQNGYYGHGFKFKEGNVIIKEDYI